MNRNRPASFRLAGVLLGRDPVGWLHERRGAALSWRAIARELYLLTDGHVDVTDQTLRNWYRAAQEEVRQAS